MDANKNASGVIPHQLTREEFIDWWESIETDSEKPPKSSNHVIYLGQDPVEEASAS